MGSQGDYSAADFARDKKMSVAKGLGGAGFAIIFFGFFMPIIAMATVGTAALGNGIIILLLAIVMISFIISWKAWKRMLNYSYTVSGGYGNAIWLIVYSLYGWYTCAGAEDIVEILEPFFENFFDTDIVGIYVGIIVLAHIMILIAAIIGLVVKVSYNGDARQRIREFKVGETDEEKTLEDGTICPNCGKRYREGAKFCPACGIKLEEMQVSVPLSAESVKTAPEEEFDDSIGGLLKRASAALKAGVFLTAEDLCTQILKEDPENAEAYLIRFMAGQRLIDREALARSTTSLTMYRDFCNALNYADAALKAELEGYISVTDGRHKAKSYENAAKLFELEEREKQDGAKLKLLNDIIEELRKASGYENADKKIEYYENKKQAFVEEVYEKANKEAKEIAEGAYGLRERIDLWEDLAEQFLIIQEFSDSRQLYEECLQQKESCEKKFRIRNICIIAAAAFVIIAACMG